MAPSQLQGAQDLILRLFVRGSSEASPEWSQASPRVAQDPILRLLLNGSSEASPERSVFNSAFALASPRSAGVLAPCKKRLARALFHDPRGDPVAGCPRLSRKIEVRQWKGRLIGAGAPIAGGPRGASWEAGRADPAAPLREEGRATDDRCLALKSGGAALLPFNKSKWIKCIPPPSDKSGAALGKSLWVSFNNSHMIIQLCGGRAAVLQ